MASFQPSTTLDGYSDDPCGECVRKWKISKCMICFFELWALNSFETPPFFRSSVRLKNSALKKKRFFHMSSEREIPNFSANGTCFLKQVGPGWSFTLPWSRAGDVGINFAHRSTNMFCKTQGNGFEWFLNIFIILEFDFWMFFLHVLC